MTGRPNGGTLTPVPETKSETCPKCGAPGGGLVCSYCGAAFHEPGDERGERAALDAYHAHIDATPRGSDHLARLIADGYIPASFGMLVEAGMRSLSKLDLSNPIDTVQEHYARRLELIATRLRAAHDEAGEKAAREFETGVLRWREADARETRLGCTVIVLLLGLLAWGAWSLLKRFF